MRADGVYEDHVIGILPKCAIAEVIRIFSDKVARQIYDARLKTLNDRNSDMTIVREEGWQEGIKEGFIEGETIGIEKGLAEEAMQAKLETAKNLLSMQLSIEQVALGTGLSAEEIEQLK